MSWWTVPPLWEGETAFIVAGGPSAAGQNLSRLAGRKVIACNSAWTAVPFAQYLLFADNRWWTEYGAKISGFPGDIVACTTSLEGPFRRLRKIATPSLAADRGEAFCRRTILTVGMTLASHLGVRRIVLLGADGKRAADGRSHHHPPHPWPVKVGCWDEQRVDLASLVGPLMGRGIEVLNASPGSAWADLWPVVTLDEALVA